MVSSLGSDALAAMSQSEREDHPMASGSESPEPAVVEQDPLKQFLESSFSEILSFDTRPTFVVDFKKSEQRQKLQLVFCNEALEQEVELKAIVSGAYKEDKSMISWVYTYASFKQYVERGSRVFDSTSQYLFKGYGWTRYIAFDRWIVMSGHPFGSFSNMLQPKPLETVVGAIASPELVAPELEPPAFVRKKRSRPADDPQPQRSKPAPDENSWPNPEPLMDTPMAPLDPAAGPHDSFDWTRCEINEYATPYLKMVRGTDWASTPIGPISSWSSILRSVSNQVMIDTKPAVLFWGPSYTMIYNYRYQEMIGPDLHATCLGTNVFESLSMYADYLHPIFKQAHGNGHAVALEDLPFALNARGKKFESFANVKFAPILDETGRIGGFHQTSVYTTPRVQSERRVQTLKDLSLRSAEAEDHLRFGQSAMDVFQVNESDSLVAMMYTRSGPMPRCVYTEDKTTGAHELEELTLLAYSGIDEDHPDCIYHLEPDNMDSKLLPAFKKVCAFNQRVVLNAEDGTLPEGGIFKGIKDPHNSPLEAVVVEPLRHPNDDAIFGFLILSPSPRVEVDEKYLDFTESAARLMGTWLVSLNGLRNEIMIRAQSSEEHNSKKEKLAIELHEMQQHMTTQGNMLEHFVSGTRLGIFMASGAQGNFIYRNKGFNDIHELNEDVHGKEFCVENVGRLFVNPDDLAKWNEAWHEMLVRKEEAKVELRLKRTWKPPRDDVWGEDEEQYVWVEFSGFPELGEGGELLKVMGNVTDITELKWRVEYQERLTKEALESKRRLENFIDTTNHELRNPLSAIIYAGGDIVRTIGFALPASDEDDALAPGLRALLEDLAESGRIVVQCAHHQKRIVNDVLTVSRLDSNLVSICPSVADPEGEIRGVIKILNGDAVDANVVVTFDVADSYRLHATGALLLDATRFTQVCMNLLSNAIKFTQFEHTRTVTVHLEAKLVEPTAGNETFGVAFFAPWQVPAGSATVDDDRQRAEEEAQWGGGDSVYLVVTVVDTGRGLSDEEKEVLFTRFGQASPRTHTRYGGSGLGLFISRRLTEIQGGRIGFRSNPKTGSTFSYYVRARRATDALAAVHRDMQLVDAELSATPMRRSGTSLPPYGGPVGGGGKCQAPAEGVVALPAQVGISVAPRVPRCREGLTVMVVEDNVLNQSLMAKGLRKAGCTVLVANHGAEALELLAQTRWCSPADGAGSKRELSCMLLDWEMPVMDGLTCVRKIREMEGRGEIMGHLPVIGVTANVRPEQQQKAIEAGMDGVVAKPAPIHILVQKVSVLLDEMEVDARSRESS